jgi:hypothetical protein
MSEEYVPEPLPGGSLGPPRRYPPTAVGVMTPEPEPAPFARRSGTYYLLAPVLRAVARAFRGAARLLGRS